MTNTDLDGRILGQYRFNEDYYGYPVYKKTSFPHLYLFYHENRWVLESKVGKVMHPTGRELWGWIRYNGTYICPNTVGQQWMYYADSVGIMGIDNTINVSCVV